MGIHLLGGHAHDAEGGRGRQSSQPHAGTGPGLSDMAAPDHERGDREFAFFRGGTGIDADRGTAALSTGARFLGGPLLRLDDDVISGLFSDGEDDGDPVEEEEEGGEEEELLGLQSPATELAQLTGTQRRRRTEAETSLSMWGGHDDFFS